MRSPLWLAAALLCVAAGPAAAHDTWFAVQPGGAPGELLLALTTGNRFPHQEFAIGWEQLRRSGCSRVRPRHADGAAAAPLHWVADSPSALLLRAPLPAAGAVSCFAQLQAFEIEIDDAKVAVYLDEINAAPALRQRWAALRARGVRWHERYVKHARIEWAGGGAPAAAEQTGGAAASDAVPLMDLDIRLERGAGPLRAGDTLRAQVLRDGQPLAGLALQLRSDLSPVGLWLRSDAQGRVEARLPLAAQWILRGVDLRPSVQRPQAWDSRFVTLAFEALPRR